MVEVVTTRIILQIVIRGVVGEITKMVIRDTYQGIKHLLECQGEQEAEMPPEMCA